MKKITDIVFSETEPSIDSGWLSYVDGKLVLRVYADGIWAIPAPLNIPSRDLEVSIMLDKSTMPMFGSEFAVESQNIDSILTNAGLPTEPQELFEYLQENRDKNIKGSLSYYDGNSLITLSTSLFGSISNSGNNILLELCFKIGNGILVKVYFDVSKDAISVDISSEHEKGYYYCLSFTTPHEEGQEVLKGAEAIGYLATQTSLSKTLIDFYTPFQGKDITWEKLKSALAGLVKGVGNIEGRALNKKSGDLVCNNVVQSSITHEDLYLLLEGPEFLFNLILNIGNSEEDTQVVVAKVSRFGGGSE